MKRIVEYVRATERDFKRAIRGRKILVMVQSVDFWIMVSRGEAIELFREVRGDLAWDFEGDKVYLHGSAEELFGRGGEIERY